MIENNDNEIIDESLALKKQLGFVGLQLMALNENIEEQNQRDEYNRSSDFERDIDDPFGMHSQTMQSLRLSNDGYKDFSPLINTMQQWRDEDAMYDSRNELSPMVSSIYDQSQNLGVTTRDDRQDGDDLLNDNIDPNQFFSPLISTMMRWRREDARSELIKRRTLEYHFDNLAQALADGGGGNRIMEILRRWQRDFFWNLGKTIASGMIGALKAAGGLLVDAMKFVGNSFKSVLFGTKEPNSVEHQILRAVKQQTEFFMTGKIDLTKSLMDKLHRSGIVGTALGGVRNAIAGTLGVTKARHQSNVIDSATIKRPKTAEEQEWEREVKAARSFTQKFTDVIKSAKESVQDSMSARLFSDDVVKYGSISPISQPKSQNNPSGDAWDNNQDTSEGSFFTRTVDVVRAGIDTSNFAKSSYGGEQLLAIAKISQVNIDLMNAINNQAMKLGAVHNTAETIKDVLERSNSIDNQENDIASILSRVSETNRDDNDRSNELIVSRFERIGQNINDTFNSSRESDRKYSENNIRALDSLRTVIAYANHQDALIQERESIVERIRSDEQLDLLDDIASSNSSIIRHTRATASEVNKHRRQALFGKILGGIMSAVSGIVSMVGSLGTMALGILGLKKILGKGKIATAATATAATAAATGGWKTKAKIAVGTIGAIGAALSKKGIVSGFKKIGELGGILATQVKTNGFKASLIKLGDVVKGIDKNAVKNAATAAMAGTGVAAKESVKIAKNVMTDRKAIRVAEAAAVKKAAPIVPPAAAAAASTAAPAVKKKGMFGGTGAKVGGALIAGVVLDKVVNETDEYTKTGAFARIIQTGVEGMAVGQIAGAGVGAGVGALAGGVGAIPGAVVGSKIGALVGGAGGLIKGTYDNWKGITSSSKRPDVLEKDVTPVDGFVDNPQDRNMVGKIVSENTQATITGQQQPLEGVKSAIQTPHNADGTSKIIDANNRNELWAKPHNRDEGVGDSTGILQAVQEKIAMPLDYVKNLYGDTVKLANDTIEKLSEGNTLTKEMSTTLKEMLTKMDETGGEGSPFGNSSDASLSGF